ncbi:MAG: SMC-Scp complex subunit ScpB [Proteobacteria bacterium]|nr:SMC-Scp complex subunit ScpB [Pseudomonadota bacterium]
MTIDQENQDPKPSNHETEATDVESISFVVETDQSTGEPVFENHDTEAVQAFESLLSDKISDAGPDSLDVLDDDLNQEFLAELEAADSQRELPLDLTSEGENGGQDLDSQGLEGAVDHSAEASDESGALTLSEELTIQGKIEAIIFASPKPLRTVEIHELLHEQGHNLKEVQDALDELIEHYRDRAGGFHLKYIKRMGYQFQTTTAAKSLMEKQFSSRPRPLSRASLETLAVIAYRQKTNKTGVTRAEVEFIRGVDAGSIFKTLIERNLLTCVGRKEIPGRPMLFGVTDEFLKVFQLGSLNDLPPLESFQTPSDVIQAANEKIAQFEAEQEGVDPEEFIGDEEYTDNLGEGNLDVLALEATPFAVAEVVTQSDNVIDLSNSPTELSDRHTADMDAVPADILADMARDSLEDITDEDRMSAISRDRDQAVPKDLIEELAGDLLNRLNEGQVAFEVPLKLDHSDETMDEERAIVGASAALEDIDSFNDELIIEPKSADHLDASEDLPIDPLEVKEKILSSDSGD